MAWFRCIGGSSSPSSGDFKKLYFGTLISAVYIDDGNGAEVAYNGWSATDFIEIFGNELTVPFTRGEKYNAFYDSSKTFISSFRTNLRPVTIPQNAKYVRFSDQNNSISADYYFFSGSES